MKLTSDEVLRLTVISENLVLTMQHLEKRITVLQTKSNHLLNLVECLEELVQDVHESLTRRLNVIEKHITTTNND